MVLGKLPVLGRPTNLDLVSPYCPMNYSFLVKWMTPIINLGVPGLV